MERWEVYMPHLLGEDAKVIVEEIQHDHNGYLLQKEKALERWKEIFGSEATYCRLIVVFLYS